MHLRPLFTHNVGDPFFPIRVQEDFSRMRFTFAVPAGLALCSSSLMAVHRLLFRSLNVIII